MSKRERGQIKKKKLPSDDNGISLKAGVAVVSGVQERDFRRP